MNDTNKNGIHYYISPTAPHVVSTHEILGARERQIQQADNRSKKQYEESILTKQSESTMVRVSRPKNSFIHTHARTHARTHAYTPESASQPASARVLTCRLVVILAGRAHAWCGGRWAGGCRLARAADTGSIFRAAPEWGGRRHPGQDGLFPSRLPLEDTTSGPPRPCPSAMMEWRAVTVRQWCYYARRHTASVRRSRVYSLPPSPSAPCQQSG